METIGEGADEKSNPKHQKLPAKLAPVLRNHLFRQLHALLPTNASWIPKEGKDPDQAPKGCGLCGDMGVEENLEHLLVKCRITKAAIGQIIEEAKGEDRSRLKYLLLYIDNLW